MSTSLVTGGAGFIGSHLVDLLIRMKHKVVVLDDLSRGLAENINPAAEFISGSVLDPDCLSDLFVANRFGLVFHLAARSRVMSSSGKDGHSFMANVTGTNNLLRQAKRSGVQQVIFSSSREVYGEPNQLPVNEQAHLKAINQYGESKIACEALCRRFDSGDMIVSVLRLANAYGPRDRDRVIPAFIYQALNGLPLRLFGGEQLIDFVPVRLVAKALMRVASQPGGSPINVGSGKGTYLKSLARQIIEETGSSSSIVITPPRGREVVRFVADVTQMRDRLDIDSPDPPLIYLPELIAQACSQISSVHQNAQPEVLAQL